MPRRIADAVAARLLALALLLLLPGCAERAPPTPPTNAPDAFDLDLVQAGQPQLEGPRIVWNFTAHWLDLRPSGDVNLTLDVRLYGRIATGNVSQHHAFRADESKDLQFRTPFLGPGDYYYGLEATSADGRLVGRLRGFFETCLVHTSAQQC